MNRIDREKLDYWMCELLDNNKRSGKSRANQVKASVFTKEILNSLRICARERV